MVKLNKIYTRTGDDGTTGLGNGERRSKADLRVEAYGTVDEANAAIGMAILSLESGSAMRSDLLAIQNDLFDLGADLATPDEGKDLGYEPLRITQPQVDRMERLIDRYNADLQPLNSFVLPGGSAAAAHLHLARTITRRAERAMVELASRETVSQACLRYVNRLSDFLFVASRVANGNGKDDVLWVPGKNRHAS
jgi:cob(I)alamin adenosyltransferase